MSSFLRSKQSLLYIMSISMMLAFSAWTSLLNNFVIESASFDGSKIGILQSLREIPGLLAFSVVLVIIFISQQRLAYISILLLGFGTAVTGLFPNEIGLYITTIIMSIGFHYLETLNQSLSLQWLSKKEAPIVLGRITSVKSITSLVVLILMYLMMKFYTASYQVMYLFFGGGSFLIGIVAWIFFQHFKDDVVQEKSLKLKKRYWLYYLLTFLAGARRQIFVVFAGFLLVEKFGLSIQNMLLLLIFNSTLNSYIAPKIGKFIASFGERLTLKLEYFGLILIFTSYALVNNLYFVCFLYIIDNLLFSMGIALKTYLQKIADPKDIASTSAISFAINHIAAVVLPVVLGIVWIKSYYWVFIIGAIIAFSSFALSMLVPKNPKTGFETVFNHFKKDLLTK